VKVLSPQQLSSKGAYAGRDLTCYGVRFDLHHQIRFQQLGYDDHGRGWPNLVKSLGVSAGDTVRMFGIGDINDGAVHVLVGSVRFLKGFSDNP